MASLGGRDGVYTLILQRRALSPGTRLGGYEGSRLFVEPVAGPSLLEVLAKLKPLVDVIRQPQGRVADRIAQVGEANVVTSVVVACELRYGAATRGSRRLTRQVDAVLGALTIRPLDPDVERIYAAIRVALEKKGTPIDNLAELKRVPALKVETWVR